VGASLVSVVTAVYNGADYLGECVESVLGQTHENWDYTIVDNASSDSTPDIAQKYAARDSRIRHLRFDEFVDSTTNHNRAFQAINPESEFCKVVQADDWLYPECLSLMVAAAGTSRSVGVISAYQLWDRRLILDGLPYSTTLEKGRNILRGTLLGRFNVTGSPTAHMFRSAHVRERRPFWEEGFRSEDLEATLRVLTRSDFAFVHQVLTFMRRQPGSRFMWSEQMNYRTPEEIVFLLRYGKRIIDGKPVLEDNEYRVRLRALLKSYAWWHVRQFPRVSRMRDPEFFDFHGLKRSQILAEAKGDPEVTAAMGFVGTLLFRGKARNRPHNRNASTPTGPA
jgi:glycosyltransferase involved in cell wall biosynthesis